jgi:hypothetical protein
VTVSRLPQPSARSSWPRVAFVPAFVRLTTVLFSALTLTGAQPFAHDQDRRSGGAAHRISGRVVDSRGGVPTAIELRVGREEGDGAFGARPVELAADGSFSTRPLAPGVYVLEARPSVRTRDGASRAEGAVDVITLGASDVTGVVLRTQPPFSVTGQFRMESDNRAAAWPRMIAVLAGLAIPGAGLLDASSAEGAPSGTFVIRNIYGPRVLRCGYDLAPGSRWWPDRVLLDGADITDVPTDFSTIRNARLEVAFTQHPSRIAGRVVDARGQAVPGAWIVLFSADRARWQAWSAAAHAVRAAPDGTFDVPTLPGLYLVSARGPAAFPTDHPVVRDFERLARTAVSTELHDRERKVVALKLGG